MQYPFMYSIQELIDIRNVAENEAVTAHMSFLFQQAWAGLAANADRLVRLMGQNHVAITEGNGIGSLESALTVDEDPEV